MGIAVVKITKMADIPESCLMCSEVSCNLGASKTNPEVLLKKYLTERHKDCPLRVMELEEDR